MKRKKIRTLALIAGSSSILYASLGMEPQAAIAAMFILLGMAELV